MAGFLCGKCPLRTLVEKRPASLWGRLWRWHLRWCPIWRAYLRSLPASERQALRERYGVAGFS